MSARDIENERLLREIGKLWAKAEATPKDDAPGRARDTLSTAPLSADLLERIVVRVTTLDSAAAPAGQAGLAGKKASWLRAAREHRQAWTGALGVAAAAGVVAAAVGWGSLRDLRSSHAPTPDVPIQPTASLDADTLGGDRLHIRCAECADGTLAELHGASSAIENGAASLMLPAALPLGANRVLLQLRPPATTQLQAVELELPPVEYRIRPDTRTLGGDAPALTLEISAVPGSQVEIAHQNIALDTHGNGLATVKLDTAQLSGESDRVVTLEPRIAYSISTPSGKTHRGEWTASIAVTPLTLDPATAKLETHTDTATIAGCTTPDAELWIPSRRIHLDPSGCFSEPLLMDTVGYSRLTLRATQPGLAPRFVSVILRRKP